MPFDESHKKLLTLDPETVEKVNNLLLGLSLKRVSEVSPGISFNKPKLLWEIQQYVQLSIHRVVELGEGATEAWNDSHPAICFILTRALMENVAALDDVTTQIETLIKKNNFIEIHNLIVNRLIGGKLGKFPDEIKIPNILTAIDKMNTSFPNYKLRYLYDFLCEFAHPNSMGMHGMYGSLDMNTNILKINSSFGITSQYFTIISLSLHRILSIFGNTILKIENLYPEIIVLCEKDTLTFGGKI